MTHDELLAKIKGSSPHWLALRAVVELHSPYVPMDNETGDYSVLAYCSCSKAFNDKDAVLYPCPTIQAIEEKLT
jgi:hypothetical protein